MKTKRDSDPDTEKNHSGSGQLRIRNEFEVKLLWKTDNIWQFLNKTAQFKNTNPYFKKVPKNKKLISLHNTIYKHIQLSYKTVFTNVNLC